MLASFQFGFPQSQLNLPLQNQQRTLCSMQDGAEGIPLGS
jgi:hypothetical protein